MAKKYDYKMKSLSWFVIVSLLASITACQIASVKEPLPAPASVQSKIVLPWGNQDWTDFIVSEIGASKLPDIKASDAKAICRTYEMLSRERKVEVLANLVAIMAKRESGWKPQAQYTESFKDAKGQLVVSRGLLQISIESANGYGCAFKKAEELHDPFKNLKCSLTILERWVAKDQSLMGVAGKNIGGARYWSVLRSSSSSYPVIRAAIQGLSICK
jgi:hypothetical protein